MIVEKIVSEPVPFDVYQFNADASGPTTPTTYTVHPGTVIVCMESDLLTGDDVFLKAYGLFFVKSVPFGLSMPADPYLFSNGNHVITDAVGSAPGNVCIGNMPTPTPPANINRLNMLYANGATLSSGVVFTIPLQVAVNGVDFDPVNQRVRAHSIILASSGTNGSPGPYIFTDHDIPVDILPSDIVIPEA